MIASIASDGQKVKAAAGELAEKVAYYLGNDARRQAIADRGHEGHPGQRGREAITEQVVTPAESVTQHAPVGGGGGGGQEPSVAQVVPLPR